MFNFYRYLFDKHWFNPHYALLRSIEAWIVSQHINLTQVTRSIDVGCGNGEFAASLGTQLAEGMDISEQCIQAVATKNIYGRCFCGSIESLYMLGRNRDLILANSVLEHVHDLKACIRSIVDSMADGAEFIIAVPLLESQNYKHLSILDESEHVSFIANYNIFLSHKHLLEEEKWKKLLMDNGLTIECSFRYLLKETSDILNIFNPYTIRKYHKFNFVNNEQENAANELLANFWMEAFLPLFKKEIGAFGSNNEGAHLFVKAKRAEKQTMVL